MARRDSSMAAVHEDTATASRGPEPGRELGLEGRTLRPRGQPTGLERVSSGGPSLRCDHGSGESDVAPLRHVRLLVAAG